MADRKGSEPNDDDLIAALSGGSAAAPSSAPAATPSPASPQLPGGASEEYIRKLLQMNPALKGDGMSTNTAVAQLTGALSDAKDGKAPKAAAVGGTSAAADKIGGQTLVQAMENVKRWMSTEQAALTGKEAELATQLKALQAEQKQILDAKKSIGERACSLFIERLLAIDPNMVSPKTQSLLDHERAFLTQIGFTPRKVIEVEKKLKKN
jgi:hypothetical protein